MIKLKEYISNRKVKYTIKFRKYERCNRPAVKDSILLNKIHNLSTEMNFDINNIDISMYTKVIKIKCKKKDIVDIFIAFGNELGDDIEGLEYHRGYIK